MTVTKEELFRRAIAYPDVVKNKGNDYWAVCPWHPDSRERPNLHINAVKKIVKCFSGQCGKGGILPLAESWKLIKPDEDNEAPEKVTELKGEPEGKDNVATYFYRNERGKVLAVKGRFEGPAMEGRKPDKEFRWKLPNAEGWPGLEGRYTMPDMPLYKTEEIVKADLDTAIFFVEGEKAADAITRQAQAERIKAIGTTLAGGSGQKDVNAQVLAVLTGRQVPLWPDNDPAGREFMTRMHAKIREVGAIVRWVFPTRPIPLKGDAVEYFAAGGTIAELADQQALIRTPTLEYLAEDSIRIVHPTVGQPFIFTLESIERSKRALDAELVVLPRGGDELDEYASRINLMSQSGVDALRLNLDRHYGKDKNWTKVLSDVVTLVRRAYDNLDRSIDVTEIPPPTRDQFLLYPLLPDRAPTILFGDGSGSKSLFAEALMVYGALGRDFLGMKLARPFKSLFIDYEDTETTFYVRCWRLAAGLGANIPPRTIYYWNAGGTPLPDLADAIRLKVQQEGLDLVVTDSIAPACPGEPERSEFVDAYFRGVRRIPATTLHIAHITKADDKRNTYRPFGSVMWHNRARRTWFVQKEQYEGMDSLSFGLYCRKVNDGSYPRPISGFYTFDGMEGPIQLETMNISDSIELDKPRAPRDRLLDSLRRGSKTIAQLADELGKSEDTTSNTLKKYPNLFIKQGRADGPNGRPADLWGLLTQPELGSAPRSQNGSGPLPTLGSGDWQEPLPPTGSGDSDDIAF